MCILVSKIVGGRVPRQEMTKSPFVPWKTARSLQMAEVLWNSNAIDSVFSISRPARKLRSAVPDWAFQDPHHERHRPDQTKGDNDHGNVVVAAMASHARSLGMESMAFPWNETIEIKMLWRFAVSKSMSPNDKFASRLFNTLKRTLANFVQLPKISFTGKPQEVEESERVSSAAYLGISFKIRAIVLREGTPLLPEFPPRVDYMQLRAAWMDLSDLMLYEWNFKLLRQLISQFKLDWVPLDESDVEIISLVPVNLGHTCPQGVEDICRQLQLDSSNMLAEFEREEDILLNGKREDTRSKGDDKSGMNNMGEAGTGMLAVVVFMVLTPVLFRKKCIRNCKKARDEVRGRVNNDPRPPARGQGARRALPPRAPPPQSRQSPTDVGQSPRNIDRLSDGPQRPSASPRGRSASDEEPPVGHDVQEYSRPPRAQPRSIRFAPPPRMQPKKAAVKSATVISDDDDQVCAICLTRVVPGEECAILPCITHRLHWGCWSAWQQTQYGAQRRGNGDGPSCPVCRHPVEPGDVQRVVLRAAKIPTSMK